MPLFPSFSSTSSGLGLLIFYCTGILGGTLFESRAKMPLLSAPLFYLSSLGTEFLNPEEGAESACFCLRLSSLRPGAPKAFSSTSFSSQVGTSPMSYPLPSLLSKGAFAFPLPWGHGGRSTRDNKKGNRWEGNYNIIFITYAMHDPLRGKEGSQQNLNCSSWFRGLININCFLLRYPDIFSRPQ